MYKRQSRHNRAPHHTAQRRSDFKRALAARSRHAHAANPAAPPADQRMSQLSSPPHPHQLSCPPHAASRQPRQHSSPSQCLSLPGSAKYTRERAYKTTEHNLKQSTRSCGVTVCKMCCASVLPARLRHTGVPSDPIDRKDSIGSTIALRKRAEPGFRSSPAPLRHGRRTGRRVFLKSYQNPKQSVAAV